MTSHRWGRRRRQGPSPCEALVSQVWMGNNTSYYELFSYGTQPSSCVQDFWT